ncbi:MAG: hypothetical protein FJ100_21190 [Deltaproteobacteria bacterium]|nr:hypothetical protein [Deltaproteobacteria bacterium]
MRIYIATAAALALAALPACEDDSHAGHDMAVGDSDAGTAMDGHTMDTGATATDTATAAGDATKTAGDGMTMDGAHMGDGMAMDGAKMDM